VILKVNDNISTDTILPAGAKVLPFRSNIPKISEFMFNYLDPEYITRAKKAEGGHAIVGGENYGQGSSREHAALAPRYLGLKLIITKSFARIHWQNLVNFGVIAVTFADPKDYARIEQGAILTIENIKEGIKRNQLQVMLNDDLAPIEVKHQLSKRQIKTLLAGGLIKQVK